MLNSVPAIPNMKSNTARKVSKYGVFSGPYFPAFELNTEKYSVSPYQIIFHVCIFFWSFTDVSGREDVGGSCYIPKESVIL